MTDSGLSEDQVAFLREQRLAGYLGTSESDPDLVTVIAEATALVTTYVGVAPAIPPPDVILTRAIIEVASELYHRKNAPNGISQFATPEGNPIRVARDPMVAARPLLAPYVGGGFA
jgi:hypothetical protein